jgi:hypothetical protein
MQKDAEFTLVSFLRAPNIDNLQKNVADVIADDYTNNNIDETTKLFEQFFLGYGNKYPNKFEDDQFKYININEIKFCVYDESDSFFGGFVYDTISKSSSKIINTPVGCGVSGSIASAKTKIPTREGMIYVELAYFD